MKTTRKATPVQTDRSDWEELHAFLATEPLDSLMSVVHPQLEEALALIKYTGPEIRHLDTLTVALRLLVEATIQIALEYHYFEPGLVKACNLLHHHIEGFGLIPDNGKWSIRDAPGGPPDTPDARLRSMLFPVHHIGGS